MNITIKNLSIKRGLSNLVENLIFKLNSGDRLAIIGEEGNGKSTLLDILYNNGIDLNALSHKGEIFTVGTIGYVRQSSDDWKQFSAYDFLMNNNKDNLDYDNIQFIGDIYKNLSLFNIDEKVVDNNERLSTLSGGEKTKLRLVKEFSKACDIILLDEPTNDLDIKTIELLEDLVNNFEGIIIFVTHDISFIKSCANKILHIELLNRQNKPKATFYEGTYNDYVKEKMDSYEKSVHQARNERVKYLKHKHKLNDMYNRATSALKKISRSAPAKARLLKKTVKRTKKMIEQNERNLKTEVDTLESHINIRFINSDFPSKSIYSLNNFDLKVENRVLINNVELELFTNEKYVIVGENGCGKTTLLKKIIADLANTEIKYFYMPQKYQEILTVDQSALEFMQSKTKQTITNDEIMNVLTSMKLDYDEINGPINNLSEGQKAKVIMSLLCLEKHDLIILDELTRNISPLSLEAIIELLKHYQGTILAVSHDRYFIDEVFNKKIVIENKELSIESTKMQYIDD